MKEKKNKRRCTPCKDSKTKEWEAFNNKFPPAPHNFYVKGKVEVPNSKVDPLLTKKKPQGINKNILLLDLFLCQNPGIRTPAFVWTRAHYDEVGDVEYKQVQIFCGKSIIADIKVKELN